MNIYFSENIRRLRKKRELTQETLADFLGISFQAVSKWERGESYPDIELLPVIADFFGVTTDYLLGIDKAKSEEEILAYIDRYDNGKYSGSEGALEFMKEAFIKYPSDFRILLRYMDALAVDNHRSDDILKNRKEIFSIYERIQNFCTNDRIRIKAKTILIYYYRYLADIENSGVTAKDMYALVDEMPGIGDAKERLLCHVAIDPEDIRLNSQKLMDSLLHLFDDTLSHYAMPFFLHHREPTDEELKDAIEAYELMTGIQEKVYSDGNYGPSWKFVIYNYGYLGWFYHKAGNDKKAIENLRKCAMLAKRFDTLPDVSERTAMLFRGMKFNKQEDVDILLDTSLCKQMTHHMLDNYRLSEEFKASKEFQEILDIMK